MLKFRIYAALLFSLLGMIVGMVVLFRGGFQPVQTKVIEERMGVLLEMAEEAENAKIPMRRLRRIGRNLGVDFKMVRDPRKHPRFKGKTKDREGRTIYLLKGRGTPMGIELSIDRPKRWLVVHFPPHLEDSRNRIFWGILVLAFFGASGAFALGRWSLRPLETAAEAMDRIAKGDLSHRVADPIGPAGSSFNAMAERLEDVIGGQKDFMAAIGHELRTPIARLKLQLALMEDEGRAASLRGDIDELENLVESLLESSRLERGGIVLQKQTVRLKALFLELLASVDIGDREVVFEVSENCEFEVDRRWFRLVIRNLLSNITRYTSEEVCIWMGGFSDENGYRLWIADSGEGVEPDFMAQMFDPFVREEKSRNKVTGGLGLGLMLVRQVADLHGGYVKAQKNARVPSGLEIVLIIPKKEEDTA